MIVFDLSCLSDDSHRRHLIDPSCNPNYTTRDFATLDECIKNMYIAKEYIHIDSDKDAVFNGKYETFKPDYPAYYEACDKDPDFSCVTQLWNNEISLGMMGNHQIWTDRPESTRDLTEKWLNNKLVCFESTQLKMRPIGDDRPQEELFEEWLIDLPSSLITGYVEGKNDLNEKPDFVFSSHEPTIAMFRARGVFVFDCNQGD